MARPIESRIFHPWKGEMLAIFWQVERWNGNSVTNGVPFLVDKEQISAGNLTNMALMHQVMVQNALFWHSDDKFKDFDKKEHLRQFG